MTTPASTARPPWARMVWSDANAIFVEIPDASGGPPYVMKFSHTDGGLSKCLNLLRSAHDRADRTNYTTPKDDPRIKRKGMTFGFNDSQRDSARAVLRKLKMIG